MHENIAIMGGTFDPVHYGHLMAAEFAQCEFDLNKVILMLSARPPHKNGESVLNNEHRLEMLKLAAADSKIFEVSTLELDRPGYSYTIDTIRCFQDHYPEKTIYFIMGSDALFSFHTWKKAEQLSTMCRFIVVTRPGYKLEKNHPQYANLPAGLWENINFLEVPGFDFSSTDIRNRVRQGKPIKYLVPPEVEQYIKQHGLYKGLEAKDA